MIHVGNNPFDHRINISFFYENNRNENYLFITISLLLRKTQFLLLNYQREFSINMKEREEKVLIFPLNGTKRRKEKHRNR